MTDTTKTEVRTIEAEAVNLIDWLSGDTTFAVPAYQRNYRWDTTNCQALLESMFTATPEENPPAFIGSILSTGDGTKRTLVDGQQRLITLALLLAALYHTETISDSEKERIARMLYQPEQPDTLRVRPFFEREPLLSDILDGKVPDEKTSFYENYEFFKEAAKDRAFDIWNGFKKLICVDIQITEPKSAQQVFESLNSTGKPLTDSELINNHILMPFVDEGFQNEIEKNFWMPIEKNATKGGELQGVHLDDFFRHYLSLKLCKKVDARKGNNERNIFAAFKECFPTGNLHNDENLRKTCQEWLDLSECYHRLLNPKKENDSEIQEYLITLNKFGESAYPFLMAVLNDYKQERIDKNLLCDILHLLETYYVRWNIYGKKRKDFAGRMASLYNATNKQSQKLFLDSISQKFFEDIPNDDLIRQALNTGQIGHVEFILATLDKKTSRDIERIEEKHKDSGGIDLEHIFPCSPDDEWSDGDRKWKNYKPVERNTMLQILNTIGNLTLLEASLNRSVGNSSFQDKKEKAFCHSEFELSTSLCTQSVWNADAIKLDFCQKKFVKLIKI